MELQRHGRGELLLDFQIAGAAMLRAIGELLARFGQSFPFRFIGHLVRIAVEWDRRCVDFLKGADNSLLLLISNRVVGRLAAVCLALRDHEHHDTVVRIHFGGPFGDDLGLGKSPLVDQLVILVDHAGQLLADFDLHLATMIDLFVDRAILLIGLDLGQIRLNILLRLADALIDAAQKLLLGLRLQLGRGLDHRAGLLQDLERLLRLLGLHLMGRILQPRDIGRHLTNQNLLPAGGRAEQIISRRPAARRLRGTHHLQVILQPLSCGLIELLGIGVGLLEEPQCFIAPAVGERLLPFSE